MNGMRAMRIAVLGSVLAGAVLVASAAVRTQATNLSEFQLSLEGAGYSVTQGAILSYPGLKAEARVITAEKAGARATVELIQYPGESQLREDWTAVNGEPPRPRQAANDFAGRVLYWNQESILVVDFSAPNDAGTAQVVGNVFLGRIGIGGPLASSGGSAAAGQAVAQVTPPSTGDGDLLVRRERGVPEWAVASLAAYAFGVMGLFLGIGYVRRSGRASS